MGVSTFFQNGNVRGHSTTVLQSVTCNAQIVNGHVTQSIKDSGKPPRKQEWEVVGDLIFKANTDDSNSTTTTLVLTYLNNFARFGSIAVGDINVINKGCVVFKDEHVSIELKSELQFMPILGLSYTLV